MFITSKNKYLSNDMKIFGTCSIPLNTQLSIIITDLLTTNSACNVEEYFKDCTDGAPKSTCQSQNALCGTHSDI